MPWKMNGEAIAVENGNPVWVEGDKEIGVDYQSLSTKLTETTRESVKRKEKIRDMETQLSVLENIEDPGKFMAEAKKAMETVKNLEDKALVDAGKVEEVKAEVTKAMQTKLDAATKERDEAVTTLQKEMIGGGFARSKFIQEKIAVPTDMIEATFGPHFSLEKGRVVAKGYNGQLLYSRESPGEPASFDEALSMLVDGYANKAAILKGSSASGAGTHQGNGGGSSGTKTMSRADFEQLDPAEQMSFFKDGKGKVVD